MKEVRNSSAISLGNYFENFVEKNVSQGRYADINEVLRAGLRLLEEEENRISVLKTAIREGLDSGIAVDFEPEKFLESLKAKRTNG